MKFKIIVISCVLFPSYMLAQPGPKKTVKKLGPHPIIIIDSNRLTHEEIVAYDMNQITLAHNLDDSTALNIYGLEAKDGVVLLESKAFARKRFVRYFKKVSVKYDSLYTAAKTDSTFQYILNDKVQKGNYEGNLALIDDNNFISLDILTADDLKRTYSITDKTVGIWIKARKPDGLYHGNKKF